MLSGFRVVAVSNETRLIHGRFDYGTFDQVLQLRRIFKVADSNAPGNERSTLDGQETNNKQGTWLVRLL